MDLSTLATAFLAAWSLLAPSADLRAYRANQQLPPIEQPGSGKFRISGNLRAGPELASISGEGAFAQPDRVQLAIRGSAGGRSEEFGLVVIGQQAYLREGSGQWRVEDYTGRSPFGRSLAPPAPGQLPPELEPVLAEIMGGFRLIGVEAVEGMPAERYQGRLDFLALAERFAPEDSRQAREMFETFTMTLDYWIGQRDRFVYRMEIGLEAKARQPRLGQPDSLSASLGVTLYELNRPVSIVAPVGPQPPPAPAPAQVPARAPARLPNTGQAAAALAPLLGGLLLVAVGGALRRGLGDRAGSRRRRRAADPEDAPRP